jgi:hypothetical protein
MEQNCEIFTYPDKFGAQKIGTLILSRQNLSKSDALCPDINGLLPSGFLTYIRGSYDFPPLPTRSKG